ncbi:MAG: succinylglutamate desuccinylase/aspartoacylase family protein, partial [Treponema sp.]|nr:succinylglutamate desuccinylase/aspartoacylase family protein [Candidatus Treponema equifaecale]
MSCSKTGDKKRKEQKRIFFVSGTHGDELEGQFVCWELIRRINENLDQLDGILEVYPALNPLGVNSMTRGIPQFDLDMNRIFPGNENGTFAEYTAAKVIEDISGADAVIDIHASNIFLREVPQVRINEISEETLVPLAKCLNTDFIWIHSNATVLEGTLAYSLNTSGTPCLVVEMGVGMRITEEYGQQLTEGILNLMKEIGIWKGKVEEIREPIISKDEKVSFLNADASGAFLPSAKHWEKIKKGEAVGKIIDPLNGTVLEELKSPVDGLLFTIREYPIVYE